MVAVVFEDITERRRRKANIVLLNEVNEHLLQTESIDNTMNTLCEKLGIYFGAVVCAFSEVDEVKGIANLRYVWHLDGFSSSSGVYQLTDYHSNEVRQLMRLGKSEIVQNTTTFPEAIAKNMQALGIGVYVNLPFVVNGQWRATLGLTNSKARIWRADEMDLMRELTFRIWARLERIRSEEALR